ncbi:hypothetical protein NEIRO03_1771 [Nematocida sp. AWRm78]|nr:hypothetical protein NEIRO02_1638 [Nematocida sp. AWRm79]KAI5184643.1 hypothetical protein NEIRO03_1771 [Nematocida sp. AWRm78]
MPHSKSKIAVITHTIHIVEIIYFNIGLVAVSMVPVNVSAPTSLNSITYQAQEGAFNSFHAMNSTAGAVFFCKA